MGVQPRQYQPSKRHLSLGKVIGTLTAVMGLTLPIQLATPVRAATPADGCSGASTALGSLCVESSTDGSATAPYVTTVHQGDRISTFKWLVNEDDSTGDPSFTAANAAACLPRRASVDAATAASNPALAIYQNAGTAPLTECPWPSVHASAAHSTVIANGNQDDVANLAHLGVIAGSVIAGNHRYLLSVTAPNFKIDGVHFEVRAGSVYSVNEEVGMPFVVRMNPLPKKTATVRIHVYNDNASTNGQWDGQTETLVTCADATPQQVAANCGGSRDANVVGDPSTDMSGFSVQITDVLNPVTTDVYGNPLCTRYETDASGNVLLNDDGTPNPVVFHDSNVATGTDTNSIIPLPGGASGGMLAGTESSCISDHYGDIVIPNMGPNRYAATVIPPDPRAHNGDKWVQTTTLEGGHDWDTWNIEGGSGYDTEMIVGGERVSPVAHGFVKLTHTDQIWNDAQAAGKGSALENSYYNAGHGFSDPLTTENKHGVLTGIIAIGRAYIGSGGKSALAGTNLANAKKDGVIKDGLISVSCLATCSAPTDTMVWAGRARADGTFDVTGLETGDYSVAFWDEAQSYIMAVLQYHVTSSSDPAIAVTNAGDILLPGWFTDLHGSVFNDLNGDGIRQPNEPGIPDFVLTERTRGNSLQDQGAAIAKTNDAGTFDLSQGYPLGQFLIVEAYNPRFKNTGFTYTTDNDPTPHTVHSAQVDINFLPVIGLSAKLEWGVQAFGTGSDYWTGDGVTPAPKNENGGIVGTVSYDVTRNEFDPAYSVQEAYQPGVAGVSMQLWKTHKSNGVDPDKYPNTGAVQQWGITKGGVECPREDSSRGTNAVTDATQSCKPFDYYVTESWQRPVGCKALDVNGNHLAGELALPDAPSTVDYSHNPDAVGLTSAQSADCIEAPMNGLQIGGNGTVDGNFALNSLIKPASLLAAPAGGPELEQVYADSKNNPDASDPLTSGEYIVEAVNPVDTVNAQQTKDPSSGGYVPPEGTTAKRLYRFTDETSVNIMSGDTYVPQEGFASSGNPGGAPYSLKTPTDKLRADHNSLGAGTVSKCAGGLQTLPLNTDAGLGAVNPDFNASGGSPFAGRTAAVCDAKLVNVVGGRSMNPGFFVYTDVPIPSKFYGLVNDDLNVNVDRRSVLLGEVAPASNVPVGVYDENGNWKLTAHSDVNGFYEILLPSMDTYNCPLPAGPCPNMYRLVGNDPGTLAHRNLDYNPQFRTIATEFQAWTGVVHPVDQAPTHNGITIEGPAAQFGALSLCALAVDNPTLYAIDKPYYDPASDSGHPYVIRGVGFGATPGVLRLGNTPVPVSATNWSDTQITFVVPNGVAPGPYQLSMTNSTSGLSLVNGLTFHRLAPAGDSSYLQKSDVFEVTPAIATDDPATRRYTPVHDAWDAATNTPVGFFGTDVHGVSVGNPNDTSRTSPNGRAIQRAIQAAYRAGNNGKNPKLVVIYPNTAANYASHNPNAAYFENVVLHGKVKLQGVGPGGATTSTNIVHGSNIDASQFWSATQVVPAGGNAQTSDGSYSDDWRTFASAIPRVGSGPADLPEGEGVLAIAEGQNQYGGNNAPTLTFRPGVDGLLLNGGDQQGNPGNINTIPGAIGDTVTGPTNPGPAQGGAIMVDQFVRDFNITNDQIQSNGGTYGTIRIGTPDLPLNTSDNHNERLNVANNRIVANGGTNLAGALGIFAGAHRYTVAGNDFCGNFSAEYGGAISHYGRSDGGIISKNRIYYNQGYDEGGGVMIAGALPANNGTLSPGAGSVTIDSNTLISNQSNDDGGGIRFLMAGNFPEMVSNNIVANNLSTHEGGGVALDDTPQVTLVNNTIVKNITTGTAATNAAISPPGANPANPGDVRPANPAGLSTGGNSSLLQSTLTDGSPNWSKPILVNNIFADNRAGWAELPTTVNANESLIHGIGGPADPVKIIQRWDVGVSTADGLCNAYVKATPASPGHLATNASCTQDFAFSGATNTTNALGSAALTNVNLGSASYQAVPLATNNVDPTIDGSSDVGQGGVGFVNPQDFTIDSLMWRNNTNTSFPVIVAHQLPVNLLADYHLKNAASTTFAVDAGTDRSAPGFGSIVPTLDIDQQPRPMGAHTDRGAHELLHVNHVNLSITKATSTPIVDQGGNVSYLITVHNAGPDVASNVQVTDTFPNQLVLSGSSLPSFNCAPSVDCGFTGTQSGSINRQITVRPNVDVTFTVSAVAGQAAGAFNNVATVAPSASNINDGNGPFSSTASVTIRGVGLLTIAKTVRPTGLVNRVGDLAISKVVTSPSPASVSLSSNAAARAVRYVATITNAANAALAVGAIFNEASNGSLTFGAWTCSATAGSSCATTSGNGRPSGLLVSLAAGGSVTYTISATVSTSASLGALVNTVTVAAPNGFVDTNTSNNTATANVTVRA